MSSIDEKKPEASKTEPGRDPSPVPPEAKPELRPNMAGMSPEQAVHLFVEQAVSLRASDLLFACNENQVAVFVRHLGIMMQLDSLDVTQGRRCLNYIRAMAGLDVGEHRRPLDGRWIFPRLGGRKVDLRINVLPTLYGEDITLRILDRDQQVRTLENVGLLPKQRSDLLGMLNSPSGLILVTGPTGAGKTTTLYACLNYLNNGTRKINTIEDPIEYAVEGLRQSQVNPAVELDFPELLRSVLRQSPEVIMIGEIRDRVTAQTAIRAANSGQLVLATLHAPVAAAAMQSMFALDVSPHFLSTCLRGVIAQRLFRTACPECRVAIDIGETPLTFEEVRRWLEPGAGNVIFAAAGCKTCLRTGYASRRGLFEVLTITRRVRNLIARSAPSLEIENAAIEEGMIEFRRGGLLQVGNGVTTTEEILRVVPSEHLGVDM